MFLQINNFFHHISFGGRERSIYSATQANIIYVTLLGVYEYIVESIELVFAHSAMNLSNHVVVVGIYEYLDRKGEHDLPDLGPFCHGLTLVKPLKVKEIFSTVYCVFPLLSNSFIIEEFCEERG